MGIHHRGAVIHHRREWGCWIWPGWRVTVPFALVLMLLLNPATGFAKEYKEYHCTPDTQYECAGGRCEKVNDGFQHAESFIYNTKTGVLSACLWTNCYAAKAAMFEDEDSASGTPGTITAVGKLEPAAHPGNAPVIVSLTIRSGDNSDNRGIIDEKAVGFTAVWGYGSKGLTLDTGNCVFQKTI